MNKQPDFEKMAISAFRSAFQMTEDKMTVDARHLINSGLPQNVYDFAFKINESGRHDKAAILIRYVFRAIEITPDKGWLYDMMKMRRKLIEVDWDEFIRLYDIHRRRKGAMCPCQPLPIFPCQEPHFA